jgi:flagellar basal-body rod modification protein FlgD
MAMDVGKTPGTTAPTAAPVSPTSQLGKADFMKLLVAQLKNQDPLNPVDSKEMISQLATLTSVEKLTSLDTNMTKMRAESAGMASMQATALIGKTVEANASHLTLDGINPAQAEFTLQDVAQSVSVTVRDAAGNTVRTLELGPQTQGGHTIDWDGINDEGQRALNGQYSFEITAKSDTGQPVAATSRVNGLVSEVSFDNGLVELVVGKSRISLTDVVKVL